MVHNLNVQIRVGGSMQKTGIILVRPSADFRPFSTILRPLWDQYKSAKIMDLYMRG